MKEVVIRYLFYYPNELGAHSHVHDLESVELRIVVEDADERGDPARRIRRAGRSALRPSTAPRTVWGSTRTFSISTS